MPQQTSEDVRRTEVDRESSRRLGRSRVIWPAMAALVAALALVGAFAVSQSRESAPTAEEVAASFVGAVGAFDAELAISYLADDADISELISSVGAQGVEGTPAELRLLLSLLDASGYEQTLRSCEELGGSTETSVSCTFDFHNFGSDEIGRGPFEGSSFQLTVRDGEVVQAGLGFGIDEFSPQMWEPFAAWVSEAYPEDAALMYTDETHTGMRLTEESIRLWGRHSRGYVEWYARQEGSLTTP